MNKDKCLFLKYGQNSVQKAYLRRALSKNRKTTKSVDFRKQEEVIAQRQKTEENAINLTADPQFQLRSARFQKQLEDKYLVLNDSLIQTMRLKKKLQQLEEERRNVEEKRINDALQQRQLLETDRKRKFYELQNKFRSEVSERKQKELLELKIQQEEQLRFVKRQAEDEERDKLEEKIIHRQKCKLQFQMLEQQRKANLQINIL